ncbi:MAG: protein-L-isoaspartate O-methyltransferase [Deltaproteobacteria bacterium]|nr:protein-L-isoaspartate O-methyltransferase [Deltaproteobacteria bacterium]
METERHSIEPERLRMVTTVERRIGPMDPLYRAALLSVDRARFVRPADRSRAWIDEPLPLETPHGAAVATVSAPHMYVLGFDALRLGPGDRLLELGSGSGYGAALAAAIVGPQGFVTTVEVDPHLARLALETTALIPNVRVLHDDGLRRADLLATHPKCWLTFAVGELSRAFLDGLVEGGVLVAPVGPPHDQRLLRHVRRGGVVSADDLGAVRFVAARSLVGD